MPKYFFFGLVRVQMYEFYWGHTAAQIDLIDIDQPRVFYKSVKNEAKPGQKGFSRTAEQAQKEYEVWKKRQEEEKKKGIKIDLNTFLSTGRKTRIE